MVIIILVSLSILINVLENIVFQHGILMTKTIILQSI
nr:MAG TPA: hypothetical protein [Caudoviricetes sp.]